MRLTGLTLRNSVTIPSWILVGVVMTLGAYAAINPPPIYDDPENYVVSRYLDQFGAERIRIDVDVQKIENCDLEGQGPNWVQFYDPGNASTSPTSTLFEPNGDTSSTTKIDGGELYKMRGWSAYVPTDMEENGGSFSVYVPCQRWENRPDGKREWGDRVIGVFGPVPVPKRGNVVFEFEGYPTEVPEDEFVELYKGPAS